MTTTTIMMTPYRLVFVAVLMTTTTAATITNALVKHGQARQADDLWIVERQRRQQD